MTTYSEVAMVAVEQSGSFADRNVFDSWESRQLRYQVLWAHFQNNAYRDVHNWASTLKTTYDLYGHIRDLYNPTFRIVTFHQQHLWAGPLDPNAGNGEDVPTCWPVLNASPAVQKALVRLWRTSQMTKLKNVFALQGAVFGDVFIKVVDDPALEKIKLERIDPRHVSRKEVNSDGDVIAYTIELPVLQDVEEEEYVLYKETADLIPGGGVQYRTFADDELFAWDGISAEWVSDYPFVPFVHISHNDVGGEFGWSEAFPKLSTFREIDDITSKVSDQIRKMVDSIWMFSGVRKPKRSTTAVENASIGREELPVVYAPDPQSKPHPLVAPLDLQAALSHIGDLMGDLESTFPELRVTAGTNRTSGDLSGRALLVARQEVEDKLRERRVAYDAQLILANKMAFMIGGMRSYEDYGPFASVEDLDDDKLFHTIGSRVVFTTMPTERIEQEKQLWINAALAQRVGVSLDIFLRREGWSDEKIAEILASDEYKLRLSLMVVGESPQGSDVRPVGEESLDLPDEAQTDPNKPFSDFNVTN